MAKKKTVKKKTASEEVCNSETEVARLDSLIEHLAQSIHNINARIEHIIDAHEKCKSLKGL